MEEIERLLVVDDEAPILHALQRTFEAAGYDVTACADPAEALDRLKEKPYQVLSADYMMPGTISPPRSTPSTTARSSASSPSRGTASSCWARSGRPSIRTPCASATGSS